MNLLTWVSDVFGGANLSIELLCLGVLVIKCPTFAWEFCFELLMIFPNEVLAYPFILLNNLELLSSLLNNCMYIICLYIKFILWLISCGNITILNA